jgi:hypothetical protein
VIREQPLSISGRRPCKQDSVSPRASGGSLPFIWAGRHRPAQAAYPFRLRLAADSRGQHDRDANIPIGTYLALQPIRFTRPPCHHDAPWALTPHFHPCPDKSERLFSVALAVHSRVSGDLLPVRKYGALCCPDFPHPPVGGRGRADRPAVCKITTLMPGPFKINSMQFRFQLNITC